MSQTNPRSPQPKGALNDNPRLISSPVSQAFYKELENREKNDKDAKSPKRSAFIQKRIHTLGWRNRHSQDNLYPITVNDMSGKKRDFSVRQVQRGELEGTYGTGATVWPASVVLIKYLERHAETIVKGKTVVDLGSGTGVTSIAAALFGASCVFCTDGEESVVGLARENIEKACNQLQMPNLPVHTSKYWWGEELLPGDDCSEPIGVVLVSDCVLPKLYPIAPLVVALDMLLQEKDSLAILSYEHRHFMEYDPREKFRELATEKGLIVEVADSDLLDPVYSTEDIEVWHVRRGKSV